MSIQGKIFTPSASVTDLNPYHPPFSRSCTYLLLLNNNPNTKFQASSSWYRGNTTHGPYKRPIEFLIDNLNLKVQEDCFHYLCKIIKSSNYIFFKLIQWEFLNDNLLYCTISNQLDIYFMLLYILSVGRKWISHRVLLKSITFYILQHEYHQFS